MAAADSWLRSPLRAFFGAEVFRAVLIDRRPEARTEDAMTAILAGLDEGSSPIIFPKGNRNTTAAPSCRSRRASTTWAAPAAPRWSSCRPGSPTSTR